MKLTKVSVDSNDFDSFCFFILETNNKFTTNLSLYVMSSLILAVREDYICWLKF